MNSSEHDVEDPLAGAITVTVVVHGIGDHSATDIISEAERGLGPVYDAQVMKAARELAAQFGTREKWGQVEVAPE